MASEYQRRITKRSDQTVDRIVHKHTGLLSVEIEVEAAADRPKTVRYRTPMIVCTNLNKTLFRQPYTMAGTTKTCPPDDANTKEESGDELLWGDQRIMMSVSLMRYGNRTLLSLIQSNVEAPAYPTERKNFAHGFSNGYREPAEDTSREFANTPRMRPKSG